jgi:hypothetical protein
MSGGGKSARVTTETLSPEKQARILDGAAAVFALDGYEGASMSRWLAQQTARGRLTVGGPEFAAEQFFALCQTRLWLRRELDVLNGPPPGLIDRVVGAAVEMFLRRYAAREQETG